ncbi:nitrilase-related carbon-nitrogen hydrolase [Chloroflexota bacterium]
MADKYPKFKVAAVHAAPYFLNREGTVLKACELIKESGQNRAALVAFPETFIPGRIHFGLIS